MSASDSTRLTFVPKPGDVLADRWEVEAKIGQGAMGSVYRGADLAARGRDARVAIKVLAPEHCKKTKALARFEREAQLMTTLRHPNIVRLLGVGREGPVPYLVMRFLEGSTLADALRAGGGKLPPVDTLEIIRQLCSGLSYIHHHGLVHRDVKPQNIFLGPDGKVTILDLGVVRDKSAPGLTRPGALVGTPYYMSPEQILGTTEIDRRTDVYALGAVIFEMLTGKPPFVAPSNFEVLYAHRTLPPPDASLLSGFVPKPVAAVITRAMSKNPAERQQNVHELLTEFEANYGLHTERTTPGVDLATLERQRRARRRRPESAPPTLNLETAIIELPAEDADQTADPMSETAEASSTQGDFAPPRPTVPQPAPPGLEGELRVITTVRGLTTPAQLFVDGVDHGATPASVQLSAGSHSIRVVRQGFRPVEKRATVRPHQISLLRVELEPVASARVG